MTKRGLAVAFDEEVANRIRELLRAEPALSEKRMFGGLAFLINGNMAVSVSGQGGLLLRVDPAATDDLVNEPRVRRAVMQGRAMDGWLRVDPEMLSTNVQLKKWVEVGRNYARTLPAK